MCCFLASWGSKKKYAMHTEPVVRLCSISWMIAELVVMVNHGE